MRRIQIMIDEELDDALEQRAAREDVSKAPLVRRFVRNGLGAIAKPASDPIARMADPIARMAGADDFEPRDVDDVLYR